MIKDNKFSRYKAVKINVYPNETIEQWWINC